MATINPNFYQMSMTGVTPNKELKTLPQVVKPQLEETKAPVGDQVSISTPVVTPEPAKIERKEPRGEMALMVDSILENEERLKNQVSIEQAIRQERGLVPLTMEQSAVATSSEPQAGIDDFLKQFVPADDKHKAHVHDHLKKEQKGNHLLGGHLTVEGGEHAVHHLQHAAEIKGELAAAKADVAAMKADAHAAASDGVDAALSQQAAHHAGSAVETGMQVASGLLGAASGGLGVWLVKLGIKDLKEGIKHKDAEHAIHGANTTIVGTRSLAAGVVAASHVVHGSEILASVASVAKSTLTPLGVVHGAIDAGLGIKDVVKGVKESDGAKITKGGLGIGLGTSLIAAAVGGGIPAIVAAGVFLTGKIIHNVRQHKKHAQEAAQEQQPQQQPTAQLTQAQENTLKS